MSITVVVLPDMTMLSSAEVWESIAVREGADNTGPN
jgi:hypothetical protein